MNKGNLRLVEEQEARWRIKWSNFVVRLFVFLVVAMVATLVGEWMVAGASGMSQKVISLAGFAIFFTMVMGFWQAVLLADWLSKRTKAP
jgi:hypothetical protein